MLHLPILRAGRPYKSLSLRRLTDFRTGEQLAEVSLANPGLIARDLNQSREHQKALAKVPIPELVEKLVAAKEHFLNGELPIGEDGATQTVDDYLYQISATTGMPKNMARKNMNKIAAALEKMDEVLHGLTRGEPLDKLHLNFRRETSSLGAILPNNSPGVHSLWLPATALQIPLTLKPGSREPWTPYRIAMAFQKVGIPPEAISYYSTDPNGTREILMRCGKSMFFGDKSTVEAWKGENKVQLHGPGWSKVIVGADKADNIEPYLDLMANSIAANGGRSCINVSGIWCAANGREIAERLAEKLAAIPAPKSMDDPDAKLSAFTNPKMAEALNSLIDRQLASGGVEDVTAKYRKGERLVVSDGCSFLLPTLIWSDDPDHELARAEYLFPYASVVETPDLAGTIGPTLVATLLSEEADTVEKFVDHTHIDRLNIGPIPTTQIRWDQPHEGNLFELLFHQRAVQYQQF